MNKTYVKKIRKRLGILFFISVVINCFSSNYGFAQENVITVNVNKESGKVNRLVFGANLMGFVPMPFERQNRYLYADYGGGLWYPWRMETVPKVIELARDIKLSVARFNTHNYYVWKNAIGKKRKHFLFGVDEFLKSCEEIGCVPIFIVSYYTSSAKDAADLVEYLNAPCVDDNTWACKRAENGHPDPYNVKYFEIGSEIYEQEYVPKYIDYYNAMKAVDPSVKIGAVLYRSEGTWNRSILQQIGSKVDFGIIHLYPSPFAIDESIIKYDTSDLFRFVLAMPEYTSEPEIKTISKILREKTGKDTPLAITEFNIGFAQSEPVLYRHTLGASLVIAELLKIFMKPENGVLLATYFHFSVGEWSMIRPSDDLTRKPFVQFIKRPNYYVFEFYNQHFGEVLLEAQMKMLTSYNIGEFRFPELQESILKIKKGAVTSGNLLDNKWKILDVEGVRTEIKNDILNIDFKNITQFNYFHAYHNVSILPNNYYRLSGYIKTDELIDKVGICLYIGDGRGWNEKTKSAANTDQISGTTDWQYVEVLYKSLPDATSAIISVRNNSNEGPLKGRVSIKNVKLEQFVPDTSVPYLSINASKSMDGKKVYLMVINKNLEDGVIATIEVKDFTPLETGHAWILNGPSVIATNEKWSDNVKVSHKSFAIKKQPFQFTFEPHSLTAIELISNDPAHNLKGPDINQIK